MTTDREIKSNNPETPAVDRGWVGAIAGSGLVLLAVAAAPTLAIAAIFFPPLLFLVIAAFALLGAAGLALSVRNAKRRPAFVLVSITVAAVLVGLCPEFNADIATFAGGMVLTLPLTYLSISLITR